MATEERRSTIERVVDWVRVEKDTARRMQNSRGLDPDRRLYWTIRYETLADVYLKLTGRLET